MSEKRIRVWIQWYMDGRPYPLLQWHDPVTGKRKSKSAETCNPEDCERARADLEYELNNGLHKETSRMSWEAFRESFEDEYVAGTRGKTPKVYEATLNAFEAVCRPATLRGINERTLSAFVAGLRSQGKAPSTVKVRLQFLHTALSWAVHQKLLPELPKFPAVKVPQKDPQPVPAESFERLLAKAPDAEWRAYLLTAWLAGLRPAEALALEWQETGKAPWIDFARDRVWLPAELVKAKRDQWVPLDPKLKAALLALPRHGRRVFRFIGRCGRPRTEGGVYRALLALAKAAGVRLTMRSLRRGFACRYASKVPAQVLRKLMRHANINTTLAYYANVDDAVEEAVLGPRRNTPRNSADTAGGKSAVPPDATPCPARPSADAPGPRGTDLGFHLEIPPPPAIKKASAP